MKAQSKTLSARPKSMLGIIGLFLVLLGATTVLGSLLLLGFFMQTGGGFLPFEAFPPIIYCGLLLGIMGGILGIVSLSRDEDIIVSGIAVILGVFMFCTCSALTFLIIKILLMPRMSP